MENEIDLQKIVFKIPGKVEKVWKPEIIIPESVEKIIRYYCLALPDNEWSGVLFYTSKGNFEDGTLEIKCQDIYLMDIGTPTFTEFSFSNPDIATFLANNPSLLECRQGLIHSHDNMDAFFSGQDQNTLKSEGNDTVTFVSLIVNDIGKYVAAVTRKITYTEKREQTGNYGLFNFRPFKYFNKETVQKTVIQYTEMKVTKEESVLIDSRYTDDFNRVKNSKDNYKYKTEHKIYETKYTPENNMFGTPVKENSKSYDNFKDYRKNKEPVHYDNNYDDYPGINPADMYDIEVDKETINNLTVQILTGNSVITASSIAECMDYIKEGVFIPLHKRFPDKNGFYSFISSFIEDLLYSQYDKQLEADGLDEDQMVAVFCYNILNYIDTLKIPEKLISKKYLNIVYDTLKEYII